MSIGNYAAWSAEYTPPTVRAVGQAVVDGFGPLTWSHIGFKGDDAHFGGYHRSLRWCRVTRGTGVDYSDRISRDTSQIGTRRQDALRAIDIVAPPEILIPMCSRIDWAMRHGLLDDVREWYGNDDGDNRVDGYDNFFDVVVSSDDSHLWHAHLSFYTDTVEGPHDRLIAVLLGAPGWDSLEDDMALIDDAHFAALVWRMDGIAYGRDSTLNGPTKGEPLWIVRAVKALAAAVAQIDDEVAAKLASEFAQIDEEVAAARTEIGQVDEAVVAALPGQSDAELAQMLEGLLGSERLQRVAQLAAQG